jgi:hypothetical protein
MCDGSPSGGWREVYAEMGVSTRSDTGTTACPDCRRESVHVGDRRFWCPEHGSFEAVG